MGALAISEAEGQYGESVNQRTSPRSRMISDRGIKTSKDMTSFMSALISDIIDGGVSPDMANAACNAGGKMLKTIELQLKYGQNTGVGRILQLAD
jgi:hypothetical protein